MLTNSPFPPGYNPGGLNQPAPTGNSSGFNLRAGIGTGGANPLYGINPGGLPQGLQPSTGYANQPNHPVPPLASDQGGSSYGNVVAPNMAQSIAQAKAMLMAQQMGSPQAAGMPPAGQPGVSPGAQAIHIAPFQQALQNALAAHGKSQLHPALGQHPQVDRMHAVHAGATVASNLAQHFQGTLRRNQGRGV